MKTTIQKSLRLADTEVSVLVKTKSVSALHTIALEEIVSRGMKRIATELRETCNSAVVVAEKQ